MDRATRTLLAQIQEQGRRHDAQEADHSKRFLHLEPDTAPLLSILVRSTRRTNVLEIGTSTGYSTIWLADALRTTGGHLTSIERDATKQARADTHLRRCELRDLVDLVQGDATAVVEELPGPFDLIFFDADRTSAPAQVERLLPKLTPNVLLLADNALSHPHEMAAYLSAVAALPGFEALTLPVGKGLHLAYRGS
ncbi:MAG TPA: class I SAM-dependent methyltransferase [Chloroflexota bacterium]|nr:class I SAM-dependent methyltransferase [Chloroflexota bacterium]